MIGLAAAAGVALRLAVIAWVPTAPVSDAWSYYQRAANLVDRGRYEAISGQRDATFPPAYPVLLAILFGSTEHRLLVAKLLNCVLGGLSIFLTGLLAWRLTDHRAALLAAAIAALYPRSVLTTTLILSENLMQPLLLGWLLLMLKPSLREGWARPVLGGILLACLSLTRSVGYLLWPIWTVADLVARRPWRRVFAQTILLVAVQHVLMAPWAYRNLEALGAPVLLNSVGGIDLFIGNNASADGGWYPWQADMVAIDPDFDRRPLLARDRVARDAALSWIVAHPAEAARLYLRKWWLMFRDERYVPDFAVLLTAVSPPWPATEVLPGPHVLKRYALAMLVVVDGAYWILLLVGGAGAVYWMVTELSRGDPRRRAGVVALLGTAVYFPAVSAVFHASGRYRWPTVDLLVPLAAALVVELIRRRRLRDETESGGDAPRDGASSPLTGAAEHGDPRPPSA